MWFQNKTKQNNNIKTQIMKKAILTIGLFSLVMILTSFTTPETKNNTKVENNTIVELNGNQTAGNKKVDLNGNQTAGNKKVDLNGNQTAGNKKVDLNGNQTAGNKKVD
jgi:hypothetical protein